MSGERTPDTTPIGKSGSSDDEISLREHLQRQIDLQRENGIRMFEEFRSHYNSILEERSGYWEVKIADQLRLLDERQTASQTLLNERNERNLAASAIAVEKVEKNLEERFTSQARALDKAESATEKRFESVNEFRAQLSDVIRGFMPRSEAEVRIQALSDRAEANAKGIIASATIQSERINKLELSITNRLAANDGRGVGMDKLWGYIIGGIGLLSLIVTLFLKFTPSGS